jgi:hypothetical protein
MGMYSSSPCGCKAMVVEGAVHSVTGTQSCGHLLSQQQVSCVPRSGAVACASCLSGCCCTTVMKLVAWQCNHVVMWQVVWQRWHVVANLALNLVRSEAWWLAAMQLASIHMAACAVAGQALNTSCHTWRVAGAAALQPWAVTGVAETGTASLPALLCV